ncbi:hypothetical protein LBMAG42_45900 [Deltaproteobacteria bacterium]|nr:hypothetical protein LBMAG42_45900 [Deltaproteobacteria bacterium]
MTPSTPTKRAAKPPRPRMTLAETMAQLEAAGTEQARKTYARHGAEAPMFGTSFATLKVLMKRIDVDHELALALWETGNFDARNLAMKIVDPRQMDSTALDRWAREASAAMSCGNYAATLPAEGPSGLAKAEQWRTSADAGQQRAAWPLIAQLALRDEQAPDAYFAAMLHEIERSIHTAPNAVREVMNRAVIEIGCRSPELRVAALASADRIGKVNVDHGNTACETPDARAYIEKTWAHSTAKGFATPAAHERARDLPRRRC